MRQGRDADVENGNNDLLSEWRSITFSHTARIMCVYVWMKCSDS